MKILIDNFDKVKSFINEVQQIPFDVCLANGRYVVDAKSIMGVLSLNISQALDIYADTETENDLLQNLINKYSF